MESIYNDLDNIDEDGGIQKLITLLKTICLFAVEIESIDVNRRRRSQVRGVPQL